MVAITDFYNIILDDFENNVITIFFFNSACTISHNVLQKEKNASIAMKPSLMKRCL